MGIPGIPTHIPTKSSIFARVVVLAAVSRCPCLGYIDHRRTYVTLPRCEPSLRRCLSTFASIACATTRGPGACRNDASTRRANPFRSYSYLPNDISARGTFILRRWTSDRGSYNIFHDFTEFQPGHRRSSKNRPFGRRGGGGLKETRR